MIGAASITLPLLLAGVLVASGVAKLRRPDDPSGWAEIGVPAVLRRRWLVQVHPWSEIALALALAVLGGWLGLVAGMVCLLLMAAYLWLVVRATRAAPDASCSCFGARRPITRLTVARNAWLTAVAVAAAAVIWTNPLWGGALAAASASGAWVWVMMTVVAVATALVIIWPDAPRAAGTAEPGEHTETPFDGAAELDYVRLRTPSVPVTLANGSTFNLRDLATRRPLLVLAVSLTCGSCTEVIANAPAWRAMLPELDVRFLLRSEPIAGSFAERGEPQSLHDPPGYISGSLGEWSTPTAVLFGVDGLLAGGPVTGTTAIEAFIHDVRASLDEAAAASSSAVTYP